MNIEIEQALIALKKQGFIKPEFFYFSPLKRLLIGKFYEQRYKREVLIKVAPYSTEGTKLLKNEFFFHQGIENVFKKANTQHVGTAHNYFLKELRTSKNKKTIFTSREFIQRNVKYCKDISSSEYVSQLLSALVEFSNLEISLVKKNLKHMEIHTPLIYRKNAFKRMKNLRKYNIFSTYEEKRIIEFYKKIPLEKYSNSLIHGDFADNNYILQPNGKVVIFDWEMCRIGNEYEDWGNLLRRAEFINSTAMRKLKPALVSMTTKKCADEMIDEIEIAGFKKNYVKYVIKYLRSLNNSDEKIAMLRCMFFDRLLWYVERKIEKHKN
ncbi:phosphotransferase, partial [Patescibacteria group bacterium]|nr:phosphotransferase [Patescibacteria group bacterium]